MLFSLAVIFLVGLSAAAIFQAIGLPRIIGMLATGILTGTYVLDLLDPKILGISSELRQIALIIILIKAGLSLNLSDLKKVGRPAVMMSFLPASFEILGYFYPCSTASWDKPHGSRRYGGGAWCGIPCGGSAENGEAYGRKIRH